jgi:hypothetical protein
VDALGAPVPGASVTVRDSTNALAWSGTTDANGRASGTVVESLVSNGPSISDRTPHAVSVSKAGVGTYAGSLAVRARTALRVDLPAGTAAPDAAAPTAPTDPTSHAVAASRALFRWMPGADESGIAGYLVFLDGALFGVTDATTFAFFGLDPSTAHVPSVQAVDAGGNVSAAVAGPAFTTRPEDRGP